MLIQLDLAPASSARDQKKIGNKGECFPIDIWWGLNTSIPSSAPGWSKSTYWFLYRKKNFKIVPTHIYITKHAKKIILRLWYACMHTTAFDLYCLVRVLLEHSESKSGVNYFKDHKMKCARDLKRIAQIINMVFFSDLQMFSFNFFEIIDTA